MILVCPECANPYELPDGQIAPLVQVACPHCNLAVIYDFEAANRPALRETGTGSAYACFDAASYFQALGQERLPAPKPVKRRAVESVKPTASPATPAAAESKSVDAGATARRVPAHSPTPAPSPVASPSRPTPSAQPNVPANMPAANDAGKPASAKAAPVAASSNAAASSATTAAAESPRNRSSESEAAHVSAHAAERSESATPSPSSGKKAPSLLGNLTPRPGVVQSTAAPSFTPMGRTPPANAPSASPSSSEVSKPNFAPPPSAATSAKASVGRATLAPPNAAEDFNDRSAPPKTIQFSTDALTSFLATQRPEFAQHPASPAGEPVPAPIELTERLPTQPEIAIRPHEFEDDITAKPGDFVEDDDEQAPAESSSPVESPAASVQGKHRAPHSAAREQAHSRPAPNPREATDIGLDDALDDRPPASWGKRLVLTLGLLLLVAGVTTSVLAYLQTGSFDPIPFVQTLLTQ